MCRIKLTAPRNIKSLNSWISIIVKSQMDAIDIPMQLRSINLWACEHPHHYHHRLCGGSCVQMALWLEQCMHERTCMEIHIQTINISSVNINGININGTFKTVGSNLGAAKYPQLPLKPSLFSYSILYAQTKRIKYFNKI